MTNRKHRSGTIIFTRITETPAVAVKQDRRVMCAWRKANLTQIKIGKLEIQPVQIYHSCK